MGADLSVFGRNIYFLLGLLLGGVLLTVVVVVGWIGFRTLLVWLDRRRMVALANRRPWGEGGKSWPTGRGICTRCERAVDTVYHLPGGERVCPGCLETSVTRSQRSQVTRARTDTTLLKRSGTGRHEAGTHSGVPKQEDGDAQAETPDPRSPIPDPEATGG